MSRKTLTTEEFITRAKTVHGDKYAYSEVVYVNNHTKVTLVCPSHGHFLQVPMSHLRGIGCAKCYFESKKSSTEEFIKKAKDVHGDRYDYSKVVYKKVNDPVVLVCPTHGDFMQQPNTHLNGFGCAKCSGIAKLTTEEFIAKAKGIHGDKYDYAETAYHTVREPVNIMCPTHGTFSQLAGIHLAGSGCSKCSKNKKPSLDEFITKAKLIHGDTYDYSLVKYTTANDAITILCPIHGKFSQIANSHLRGFRCAKCTGRAKSNTDEFIAKARLVHGMCTTILV